MINCFGMKFIFQFGMKTAFNIEGNLEIVKDGRSFLTSKRIDLLKIIKQKGSINAASKELRMSYQQAWHYIKEMNEIAPLPLVVRQRGGINGGGAVITKFGEKSIKEFESLCEAHNHFKTDKTDNLWLCFFNPVIQINE